MHLGCPRRQRPEISFLRGVFDFLWISVYLMHVLSNKLKTDCWDQFAFSSQTKKTTTRLTSLREVFTGTEVEKLAKIT